MQIDRDTKVKFPEPGGEPVTDHLASAKSNLRESLSPLLPDRTWDAVQLGGLAGMGLLLAPLGMLLDLGELALAPLLIPKDLVDAAVHGVLAGIERRQPG